MRRWFVLGIAVLILAPNAPAKKPHCTFRLHVAGNARDGDVFTTPWTSQNGQKLTIQKMPAISEQDVIAFKAYDAGEGKFGVLLQLDDHGRLALDALSVEHRGGSAFIFLNGRPLTEMQIDRRIGDGKIYLPSDITAADIALMRKDWPLIPPKPKP